MSGNVELLTGIALRSAITPHYPLTVLTRPTPVQHKALALLGVTL
jgi:hypothetical protein